jgi:hypothetical protein
MFGCVDSKTSNLALGAVKQFRRALNISTASQNKNL